MNIRSRITAIGAITLVALSGCATTPLPNDALDTARAAYTSAAADALVTKHAPLALKEAEESLRQAESTWQQGAPAGDVEHRAYLAGRKVAVAIERARLNAAETEVEQARLERERVRLEARMRDADAARRTAETRAREAEAARKLAQARTLEAEQAKAEAEILAKELADLKARGTERGLVLTLGDVLFDFDSANLKPGGLRVAERLAEFLKKYGERNILIEGFTDSVGPDIYNLRLSERRANAVRMALLDRGIVPQRIELKGYGEAFPVANNQTESGRQQNRRVEVIVSDARGKIPQRTQ